MTFNEWIKSYQVNGQPLAEHPLSDEEWDLLEECYEAGVEAGYTEAMEKESG